MKAKGWFVSALVAGGVVFSIKTTSGCLNKPAPDQKLAGELSDLCEIAREGTPKPEAGVRALGRYLGKHTGDILGHLGETIALIERIPDDEAHDERARLARDRLSKNLKGCEEDWVRFVDAIENDEKASALVEKAMTRLSRTIDIILGGNAWTLRDLPRELERVFDR